MFGRVLPELSEIIIQIGESFLKNQFAANGINAQPARKCIYTSIRMQRYKKKSGYAFD